MTALDGTVRRRDDGGFVVAFDRRIERPPQKVWAALTDPKVLANWLGEVELDLRVGGPFIIRFRPPLAVVMTGAITAVDAGRLIEYTWRENYGMPPSKVRWEVVPTGSGCRLQLSHAFTAGCVLHEILGFAGGWHSLLDAIAPASDGKLVPYGDEKGLDAAYRARYGGELERDEPARFTQVAAVELQRLLPGSIERVWAHLTDPRLLPAWFGRNSSIEPRQGGRVSLMEGQIRGSVTQWQPPHRLTYTWNVFAAADAVDAFSAYPESYLTLTLRQKGDNVLLVLSHLPVLEQFEKQNAMGWHTFVDLLADALASRPVRTVEEYMVRNSARYGVDLKNPAR
jgi:uncharacterized protein YndB with AHSA1/START domain